MRLLLDTHVFLWLISGDRRLPTAWQALIQEPINDVFLSVASIWEAVVKHQLGKLPLPEPAQTYLPDQRRRHRISSLPIDEQSVTAIASLPSIHRDPFDRVMVAQAIAHGLTLVTDDAVIQSYPASFISEKGAQLSSGPTQDR